MRRALGAVGAIALTVMLAALPSAPSFAYPGDVFVTLAPAKGPTLSPRTEIARGTYSVSTRTGAAHYSFPIFTPPGRNAMTPSLALTYSSQGPLRGGIAAGWSLHIPSIRVDTSSGRLAGTHYKSTLAGGQRLVRVNEPGAEPGAEPGVEAYRAERDGSYTRYERRRVTEPASERGEIYWRALQPDGMTYYFGEGNARDRRDLDSYGGEARWFVRRIVDRFGNQIEFRYEPVLGAALNGRRTGIPVDIELAAIEYSANPKARIPAHVRIVFDYGYGQALETCPGSNVPIGARFDYRTGIRIYEGARRLRRIDVLVRDTPVTKFRKRRSIELGYDPDALRCAGLHAPLRLLTSIREHAWNHLGELDVELPPVTFSYSRITRELSTPKRIDGLAEAGVNGTVGRGKRRLSERKGGGWPTIDILLVDLDGDGQDDILRSRETSHDVRCTFEWKRNLGGGAFGPWQQADLPTLPWRSSLPAVGVDEVVPGSRDTGAGSQANRESCNLAYQFTRRESPDIPAHLACGGLAANYTSYRFLDLDGDGDRDLVTALDYKPGRYRARTDPALADPEPFGARRACPAEPPCRSPAGDAVPCRTSGGLTGIAFLGSPPWKDGTGGFCPAEECPDPRSTACMNGPFDPGQCECSAAFCEEPPLSDRVSSEHDPPDPMQDWFGAPYAPGEVGQETNGKRFSGNPWCQQVPETDCPTSGQGRDGQGALVRLGSMYVWRVHWNEGSDAGRPFNPRADVRLSPIPLESDRAVASAGGVGSSWHGILDIDGDGYLDAVWQDPSDGAATGWPGLGPTRRYLVFRGDGRGNFLPNPNGEPYVWAAPPTGKRERVALQATGPITQAKTNGNFHRYTETVVSMQDINGDGLPDLVESRPLGNERARLRVFYNTGVGFESFAFLDQQALPGFGTVLSDEFTTLSRRETAVLEKELNGQMKLGWSIARRRVLDLDQDGLPDVTQIRAPAGGASKPWSDPEGLAVLPDAPESGPLAPASSPGSRSGTSDRTSSVPGTSADPPESGPLGPGAEPLVSAFMNVGDRFVRAAREGRLRRWRNGLARIQIATRSDRDGRVWLVKSDVRDFDGDGLLDVYNNDVDPLDLCTPNEAGAISPACGMSAEVSSDPEAHQGLRLLEHIDTGQGARITFVYAPGNDREAVLTNLQRDRRNPRSMRVVASVTVDPGIGEKGTTRYRYHYPVMNRTPHFGAEPGGLEFRGFEQAVVELPSNARGERRKVIERFDYGLDFAGRMVERIVEPGPGRLSHIDATDWQRFHLFDGRVVTFHRREERTRICDSGTESSALACRAEGALKRKVYAWTPIERRVPGPDPEVLGNLRSPSPAPLDPVGARQPLDASDRVGVRRPEARFAPPVAPTRDPLCALRLADHTAEPAPGKRVAVMVAQCGERVTEHPGAVAVGDRGAQLDHRLLYTADRYQLLPTGVRRLEASGAGSLLEWGPIETVARQATIFDDGGLGLALEERVWLEHDEVAVAVTEHCYALAGDCAQTLTGNPVSRRRPNQVATGSSAMTRLASYGPFRVHVRQTDEVLADRTLTTFTDTDLATGAKLATSGPFQPGSGMPRERMTRDGLGRAKEQFRSVDAEGGYTEKLYSRTTYFDHERPARARHERFIDYDSERAVTSDAMYDGLGRLVSEVVATEDGPAVTRYRYDGAGNLVEVLVPNPCEASGDDPCRIAAPDVAYRYEHDALGRVTRWIPPLDAPVVFSYDGLVTRRAEEPVPDGTPRPVELTVDVFGRLREVREKGPGDLDAVTVYDYDANDNLRRVEDADGIVTRLEHDLAGRRTAIHRGGRTWRIRYDANGNITERIAPVPAADEEADYTTRYVYDDLDRVLEQRPAPRASSEEQRARWFPSGSMATVFAYDAPGHRNAVGRLSSVTTPHGEVRYDYSTEGWVVEERRRFDIDPFGTGSITDERSLETTYNALGLPVRTVHADDSASPTISLVEYDLRGLVGRISVETPTGTLQPVAELSRNRLGLPRSRTSFGQSQAWRYDEQARTGLHAVSVGSGALTGGERIGYDGVGNVRSLESLGSGIALGFGYDRQHQLERVQSTPADGYDASYRYSLAGRALAARIASSGLATGVLPRNVTHLYVPGEGNTGPGADPGAVRRLMSVGAGRLAAFDYDESANLVRRTVGDVTWQLAYDGHDRLRESTRCPAASPETCTAQVYYYDHQGRRELLVRRGEDGSIERVRWWFDSTEIWNVHDPGARRTWVYLAAEEPVARITRGGASGWRVHSLYHGVLDHLLLAMDESDDVVAGFAYGPYGETLSTFGAAAEHLRRFNGKERDAQTGFSYYGHRDYDPLSLAWTQADPLYRYAPDLAYNEPRRSSLFTFNLNNPTRYIDPDGREPGQGGTFTRLGNWVRTRPAVALRAIVTVTEGFKNSLPASAVDPPDARVRQTMKENQRANRERLGRKPDPDTLKRFEAHRRHNALRRQLKLPLKTFKPGGVAPTPTPRPPRYRGKPRVGRSFRVGHPLVLMAADLADERAAQHRALRERDESYCNFNICYLGKEDRARLGLETYGDWLEELVEDAETFFAEEEGEAEEE